MKRKPIEYRHSYLFNPITIGLILLVLAGGITLWSTGPSLLMRVESNRVLKSTAEKYMRNRPRYLESEAELDRLHVSMLRALRLAKVADPEMEAWIEVDEAGYAVMGVIYDVRTDWPLGIVSPTTFTVRQEVQTKPR